jgi:tetratricopeptide (TPR) repeat protein
MRGAAAVLFVILLLAAVFLSLATDGRQIQARRLLGRLETRPMGAEEYLRGVDRVGRLLVDGPPELVVRWRLLTLDVKGARAVMPDSELVDRVELALLESLPSHDWEEGERLKELRGRAPQGMPPRIPEEIWEAKRRERRSSALEDARQSPERALEILAAHPDYPDARAELAWIRKDPEWRRQGHPPSEAYGAAMRGDWEAALAACRRMIEPPKRNPHFERFEFDCLARLSRHEEILQKRSNFPNESMVFARSLIALRRPREALEELNRCASNRDVTLLRATCLAELGRFDEADRELTRLLDENVADVDVYMARGKIRFAAGNYTRASIDYARAALIRSDDVEAWVGAAESLYRQNSTDPSIWESARRYYTEAIRLGCAREEVFLHRAEAASKLGEPAAAVEDLRRALEIRPRPKTWFDLAVALIKTSRFDDAREPLDRAIEGDRGYAEAYFFRGSLKYYIDQAPGEALGDVARAIDLGYRSDKGYLVRARCRLALLDPEGALDDLDSALLLNSENNEARLDRARTLLDLGRFDECIDECRRLPQDRMDPWVWTATAQARSGNADAARATLRQAISKMPGEAGLYEHLMHVEAAAGRRREAIDAISRAIELGPDQVLYRLDRAYLYLEEGRAADAAGDADHVVDLKPANVKGLELSARAHAKLSNWKIVEKRLRVALQAEGGRADLWILMAKAQLAQGSPELGAESARKGMAHPGEARLLLAEALLLRGHLREAESELTLSITADKTLGLSYLRRGEVRLLLGRTEAMEDLRRARELLPGAGAYIDLLIGLPGADH